MDTKALIEKWYKENFDRMVKHFYRKTGNREDAEDIVQTGIERAIRWSASYNDRYEISTWLTQIILNSFKDWKRDRLSEKAVSMPDICECEEDYTSAIKDYVEHLPGKRRDVMELFLKGFKAVEIYRILNMPYITVRVWISQIRKQLREEHKFEDFVW